MEIFDSKEQARNWARGLPFTGLFFLIIAGQFAWFVFTTRFPSDWEAIIGWFFVIIMGLIGSCFTAGMFYLSWAGLLEIVQKEDP